MNKMSVVMATYDDFHGVYFTVHALLMYHSAYVDEVVIIDNNPTSKHGEHTANFVRALGNPKVKYHALVGVNSTAVSRNLAIEKATSDIVVCVDPHVMFPEDSLRYLWEYFKHNPDCKDLVQGPLLYDNHTTISTHFNLNVWRGQMWGVWDTDERGNGDEPFEIPAQGLGTFATLKKHWLKFNDNFRGFGGEEGYIHEKYRQAGRKTVCVPQYLWVHRFGRPDGVPYPLSVFDKVRNYVIGHKELGLDIEPIRQHFVTGGFVNALDWVDLAKGEYPQPKKKDCASCVAEKFNNINDWLSYTRVAPSDLNEHCDALRTLGEGRTVVDFGDRPGVSGVALATNASHYTMIHPKEPPEFKHIRKFLKDRNAVAELKISTTEIIDVPPCDVLFVDMVHTYSFIKRTLEANQANVKDFIILHDTVIYGETGDDGGKGIMPAIREFLRTNRRWTVWQHYRNQHGLLVLVGNNAFKKKLPNKLRQASNFAKAMVKHVANGANKVSLEVYETRLIQCDECESRNNDRCGECGCPIEAKASLESESCPLTKW